jgi:hypothetical protein
MQAEIMIAGAGHYENRVVMAIVRGDLALHRIADEGVPGRWTITHIPSGAALARFRTNRVARRAMRQLATFDWHFTLTCGADFEALRAQVVPLLKKLKRQDERASDARGGGVMADISQYRDSSDPLLRGAYWLRIAARWSPQNYTELEQLSEEVAALATASARQRAACEDAERYLRLQIPYAPTETGDTRFAEVVRQLRAALADE